MSKARARFRVKSIQEKDDAYVMEMYIPYKDDPAFVKPEGIRGELKLSNIDSEFIKDFEVGGEYWVDFTKCEEDG